MYFENDEYYEPSVGDEIYLEAREKLIDALKDSVKQHINSVSIENEKLKQENAKLEKQVIEIKSKERELEVEKEIYKKQLRFERLSELIKDLSVIVYEVTYFNAKKEKCNKCDENRKIYYTTPMGKKASEDCECAATEKEFIVNEKILYEFRESKNNSLLMWFKHYEDSGREGYSSGSAIEVFYDNYDFKDIPNYNVHFRNKETAEKYKDFLNSK